LGVTCSCGLFAVLILSEKEALVKKHCSPRGEKRSIDSVYNQTATVTVKGSSSAATMLIIHKGNQFTCDFRTRTTPGSSSSSSRLVKVYVIR
jgi:hypothetical protein